MFLLKQLVFWTYHILTPLEKKTNNNTSNIKISSFGGLGGSAYETKIPVTDDLSFGAMQIGSLEQDGLIKVTQAIIYIQVNLVLNGIAIV